MKQDHRRNTDINFIISNIAIDDTRYLVKLPDPHNPTRISGNVDDNTGAMVLEKLDSVDRKEEIFKSHGKPREIVDLNDTEMITATPNIYYSL